jgi:Flp pilus assembly protein TadG
MYARNAASVNRRRGIVVPLACLLFVVVLMMAALAIDGGNMLAARRQAQNCADGAAWAAAIKLATIQAQGGVPTAAQLATAANDCLSATDFTNGTNCTVTVNCPPTSGDFQNNNSVEVLLNFTYNNLVASGSNAIGVRSVASVDPSGSPSVPILLIDQTINGEVFSINQAQFNLSQIPMHVNSTSPNSVVVAGGMQGTGAYVTMELAGNYFGTVQPAPTLNAVQLANPLVLVQPPDRFGMASYNQSNYLPDAGNNITLNPGYYANGINITNGGNVTLNSGVYFINGGLWINTPGTVTGNQVMLYVSGSSDAVNEDFGHRVAIWLSPTDGNYTLTAPTSGQYAGLSLFTDAQTTSPVWFDLWDKGAISTGVQYYPGSMLRLWTPQGNQGTINSNELVAKDMRLSGRHAIYGNEFGTFTNVSWNASRAANRPPTLAYLAE